MELKLDPELGPEKRWALVQQLELDLQLEQELELVLELELGLVVEL